MRSSLFGVFLLLLPARAEAYLCTAVPNSNPILSQAWNQRCIPYFISNNGALLDGEARRLLINNSFQVWSNPACTDIEFVDFGYTDQAPGFDPNDNDNENIIIAIEDDATAGTFFTRNELAITITSFNTNTGEIFDADIMINAARFRFDEVTTVMACQNGDTPLPYDLANTLVHEMGHFIGFEHDQDEDSTMFASAPECETKKRDLTQDNILGVCNVYGVGQPTRTCAPPDTYDKGPGDPEIFRDQCNRNEVTKGCGCTSTEHTPASAWWLLLGLGLLLRRLQRSAKREAVRRLSGR